MSHRQRRWLVPVSSSSLRTAHSQASTTQAVRFSTKTPVLSVRISCGETATRMSGVDLAMFSSSAANAGCLSTRSERTKPKKKEKNPLFFLSSSKFELVAQRHEGNPQRWLHLLWFIGTTRRPWAPTLKSPHISSFVTTTVATQSKTKAAPTTAHPVPTQSTTMSALDVVVLV